MPSFNKTIKINEALKPTALEIRNDSHLHAHHKAMKDSTSAETHFHVSVVSDAFEKKRQLQRHKMIYSLMADEMAKEGGIHALQLQTRTPEEAEKIKAQEEADRGVPMVNLTDLPVELMEGIMDAAHLMPHGNVDSRRAEQHPAASTFGAMRLVCRELNGKVFKRYVEILFSVHTVKLEELSLRAMIDMGKNEHFRNTTRTLFIDIHEIIYDQQGLPIFPNLREMTIEHITVISHSRSPQMACIGASAV
ncbi:BolA-like protein [Venturia nashicola]|nr:BolA-like protein [Venturia nashicola]